MGAPKPKLREAMVVEHCESSDSLAPFTADNYGTTTTSRTEYLFCADPESLMSEWPVESKLRDRGESSLCRKRAQPVWRLESSVRLAAQTCSSNAPPPAYAPPRCPRRLGWSSLVCAALALAELRERLAPRNVQLARAGEPTVLEEECIAARL